MTHSRHVRTMKPFMRRALLDLFFKIEKHFVEGGQALTIRDVMTLIGCRSTSTGRTYIQHLARWGLIQHTPETVRTIVLHPDYQKHYPPVVYRDTSKVKVGKLKNRFRDEYPDPNEMLPD